MKYKLKRLYSEDSTTLPYFERMYDQLNKEYNSDLDKRISDQDKKYRSHKFRANANSALKTLDDYERRIANFTGVNGPSNVKLPNGETAATVLNRINNYRKNLIYSSPAQQYDIAQNIRFLPDYSIGGNKPGSSLSLDSLGKDPKTDSWKDPIVNANDHRFVKSDSSADYHKLVINDLKRYKNNPTSDPEYLSKYYPKKLKIDQMVQDADNLVDKEDSIAGSKIRDNQIKNYINAIRTHANSQQKQLDTMLQINHDDNNVGDTHSNVFKAKNKPSTNTISTSKPSTVSSSTPKAKEQSSSTTSAQPKQPIVEKPKPKQQDTGVSLPPSTNNSESSTSGVNWGKTSLYIGVGVAVTFVVYKIVKWLYNKYKDKKKKKESKVKESWFRYAGQFDYLCEADQSSYVGSIYNKMIQPILNFFKSVFKVGYSIISYILTVISWGAKKVYSWVSNLFKKNTSTEAMLDQYNSSVAKIQKYTNTSVLRNKIGSITNALPQFM